MIEWNRKHFIIGYQSNGTGRSSVRVPVECQGRTSVYVTGRMEQECLRCGVPVEWNRELFCVV